MLVIDALDLSKKARILCVSEMEGCRLDAVQVLLGCTVGTESLRYRPRGKKAFSFYNLANGKSCRIVEKPLPILAHDEMIDYILAAKAIDLFDIKPVLADPPGDGEEYLFQLCSGCGELTGEPYLRILEGMPICLDCLEEQKRSAQGGPG